MPSRTRRRLVRTLRLLGGLASGAACGIAPDPAFAWGPEGHEVVALIARDDLTPATRAKVDAILARDPDPLTAPDMIARANWADAWRDVGRHRETASWHFVDIELDHPDLGAACHDDPAGSGPASAGPADDCVVDKVDAFETELADPATAPAERLLALKYLLHFVGDLHQPLHASDNHDRGGNCVRIALGEAGTSNLHRYWDTTVIEEQDPDARHFADTLRARITARDRADWERGRPRDWAMQAFAVARAAAYTIGSAPGCGPQAAPITLPAGYDAAARAAADLQLERAGVRLALVLNRDLGRIAAIDN